MGGQGIRQSLGGAAPPLRFYLVCTENKSGPGRTPHRQHGSTISFVVSLSWVAVVGEGLVLSKQLLREVALLTRRGWSLSPHQCPAAGELLGCCGIALPLETIKRSPMLWHWCFMSTRGRVALGDIVPQGAGYIFVWLISPSASRNRVVCSPIRHIDLVGGSCVVRTVAPAANCRLYSTSNISCSLHHLSQ